MQPFPLAASPLYLEHYYIQALRFETKEEFDSEEAAVSPTPDELQWDLEHHATDTGLLAFRLTLQLPPENARFPYAFEIILIGFFHVDENFEGDAIRMADANAPAVLFSAAREAIANLTGRGPFPALSLPTVHFQGIKRAFGPATEPESPPVASPETEKRKTVKRRAKAT